MHTPSPWTYDTARGADPCACRVRHAGLDVAAVFGDTPEESEANAALIASAPEMLQALRYVLRNLTTKSAVSPLSNEQLLEHVRAAITHADPIFPSIEPVKRRRYRRDGR